MAKVTAKNTVKVKLTINDREAGELVEQLLHLVDDNRSTTVTQNLLDALKGLGF